MKKTMWFRLKFGLSGICLIFLVACGNYVSQKRLDLFSGVGKDPAVKIATIPFQVLLGGAVLVKARINDLPDTLNFLLDTGSSGISLDSALAEKLKMEVVSSSKYLQGFGGKFRMSYIKNATLRLPGFKIDSLDFFTNNYTFLSAHYGIPIAGMIGYAFLKDRIVNLDYDKKEMTVYTPGLLKYPGGGTLFKPMLKNIPIMKARAENKGAAAHTHFYFDTGGGLYLILTSRMVSDSSFFYPPKRRKHKVVEMQTFSFTGELMMKKTVIQRFRLGKYKFKKLPVLLYDDQEDIFNYPTIGGLIGNDLLRHFNVFLNYPEGEIYLRPNTSFKEKFDYSYTGLTLAFEAGMVIVADVREGSPAFKAGLQRGDRVIAVNGDLSQDLLNYRKELMKTGEKVNLIIKRDREVLNKYLKVKSLL